MALENIEKVKFKYEKQLRGLPHVKDVSIGVRNNNKIIKVFVTKKISEKYLLRSDIIPKILDGYIIDVEENLSCMEGYEEELEILMTEKLELFLP